MPRDRANPGQPIIVADLDDDHARARDWRDRLTQAWPVQPAPECRTAGASELGTDLVSGSAALVLIASREVDEARVLMVLALAEEAGVPVLSLLTQPQPPGNCFEFGGALAAAHTTPDSILGAALWGMVHRQGHIDRLRAEAALAQRFHGGLRGQIAKMHDELQLAAMVQREFLPRELPEVNGVRFAALWRPTHYVSGDIYDVLRLNEDHVGLFVADASGHGVPAALTTMVIIRSLCATELVAGARRIMAPGQVLARLNEDMLRRQGDGNRFATAVYALVDCRARRLVLAGAGHPPALLLRRDGTTLTLESDGGLLGVFPDERYGTVEIDLEVGDRLLMYSDGFEQAFPDREAGSRVTQRYLKEFEALRRMSSPRALVDELRDRLDSQSGSLHQADDVTLLCMHVGAPVSQAPAGIVMPGAVAAA